MWYFEGCVAPPIQEMRLAVALAVLYNGMSVQEGGVF